MDREAPRRGIWCDDVGGETEEGSDENEAKEQNLWIGGLPEDKKCVAVASSSCSKVFEV